MKRIIESHTFKGLEYCIRISEDVDGSCSVRKNWMPMLVIMAKLKTKRGLNVAIHEAIHACGYYDEKEVTQIANDISEFLWKLGYRKVK